MTDYRELSLSDADQAMLDFAVKLTKTPGEMSEADIHHLREKGFDDVQIHDIVQVVGCFGYFNRLTSGLGVDLEEGWQPLPPRKGS